MHILTALTLSLATATAATAEIPSQTFEFTAAEGFTDGPAKWQNGLAAQDGVAIETAGDGRFTSPTKGYLRLFAFRDAIDLNGLAVGESVTLVARGVQMRRELPAAREQFMAFGLAFEQKLDADVEAGAQLLFDPEGRVWLDDQKWPDSGQAVDTGLQHDDPFDVVTVVTRTGPKSYTADTSVNGVTARTAEVRDAETVSVGLLCQVQGTTAGTWSVDALDVNPATLPGAVEEPE